MDNQNNPSSPNDPNQTPPPGGSIPPVPDLSNLPSQTPPPIPTPSTSAWPTSPAASLETGSTMPPANPWNTPSTPSLQSEPAAWPSSPTPLQDPIQPATPADTNPFQTSDTWPPSSPTISPTADQPSAPDWTPPIQSIPNTLEPASSNAWQAPVQQEQTANSTVSDITPPSTDANLSQNQTPSWVPPVQPPQPETLSPTESPDPLPTFTSSQPITPPNSPSPLDNPWGAPTQAPSIDNSQTSNTMQPSWSIPITPTENQGSNVPPVSAESAPTDLSHLISGNNPQQEQTQPAPENLVVPPTTIPNPEIPNLPTQYYKGIPKWVIGLGIGLLIVVIGASAYFILGIGQPTKTASLPAVTATPRSNTAKPPLPTSAPAIQPTQQPMASGAANFGELGSSSGSNENQPTATSAADLLRQRQQAGQ